ncbi:MAG: hypothetical protein J6J97_09045 [Akkermansia sp.]|nr:hypothetical protein [Akkermansia sp.]MBQ2869375.1 hypothetical protein [Akkermansia sp.]MBQ8375536.1 hypothetical protein [Akkermansia sp.]
MLKRCYRVQESQVRYWAQQAVELCEEIDDESLNEVRDGLLDSIERMGADRRVVMLGATRSGKSELLAGMVGAPVIGRVEPAHHYLRWRYMNNDGDSAHCRFLPEPNLFGMELVNTRGCENPLVAEAVAPLLPGADVVVAVVDARTLQDSPVWALLAPLPEEGGPACMVALTHTDALDAEHTVTLSDTVRQLCRERVGRALPVYQVNPTNAALADAFGDKVVEAMESSSGGLRAAIREVMRRGSDLLYKQGSILKARDAVARTDSGFLQGIEQEIDNFLARQMQGVRNCVLNYAASAQRSMPKLLLHLRRSMGWFLSPVVLLRLESYASAAENLYYRLVLDDVTLQQEELDKQFVHSCGGHWRSVRPRMKQTLQCEIGDFPAEELEKELEQLRQRLQSSLYEPFRYLRIRSHFASLFKCQVDWMRFFTTCLCLSLTAAGLLGFFALESLAFIFLGVAAAFWMLGTLIHLLVVRKICQLVRKDAEPLRENLSGHMAALVQDMIVSRVAAYRRLYTDPRKRVAEYETSLAPLQQRQSEIFRQLRSSAPHV